MATTVHLPAALLKQVDDRARRLNVSRNQYVRRALERMIERESDWSPAFVESLHQAAEDDEGRQAADEMMQAIRRRSRKRPPRL